MARPPFTRRKFLGLAAAGAVGAGGYAGFSAVRRVQNSAARSVDQCHLKCISIWIHWYVDAHGHFPPAYLPGPDGRPWHSWRVLILAYHGEGDDLYRQYSFDEPWDG